MSTFITVPIVPVPERNEALSHLYNRADDYAWRESLMTSTILSIDIEEEIHLQLESLAKATGQDKHDIARAALIEWLEDLEDARDAVAILERCEPSSSIHDVRKRLGLER